MDQILEQDEEQDVEEQEVEEKTAIVDVDEDPAELARVSAAPIIDSEQAQTRSGVDPHDDEAFLELLQRDDMGADAAASLSVPVHAKRDDEFVCRACYLVKHRSQLVDPARQICLDCAA